MIGGLLYRLRSRFKHGVRTAWYRDVVRKRILSTAPIAADDCSVCEIHVLTSESDWINLLWALKSFYHASGRRYGLCVHDDGSLTNEIRKSLADHFPQARILDRQSSEEVVVAELADHPRCREFRLTNHLSPKVFDFRHHLRASRMLLLDSDVLFFQEPKELLRRIEDPSYRKNSVNGDVTSAYSVDPVDAKSQCGVDMIDNFNSGLGVIHRDSVHLDWVEEFLGLPNVLSHFWRIEQTLYALCSCRYGVELLPESYDVFLENSVGDRQSRHYVGAIRHHMYDEGIAKLVAAGLLTQ